MRLRIGLLFTVALSLLIACGVGPAAAAPAAMVPSYTIVDRGTLPGGSYSYANGINNLGQVVGEGQTGGSSHAFLRQAGAGICGIWGLGTLPGCSDSRAIGINDLGQIVGYSSSMPGDYERAHAVLWQPVAGTPATTTASLAPRRMPLAGSVAPQW
jgi:probable HAF family extracellular repeat protein